MYQRDILALQIYPNYCDMNKKSHLFSIRVYYEDTDAGGVVYHSNYMNFAERARTEILRLSGINQSQLLRDESIGFVMRRCIVDFLRPALLDDLLTIESKLHDIGRASISMEQSIKRGDNILVNLEVKLAAVNASFKPVRLPVSVRNAMISVFE